MIEPAHAGQDVDEAAVAARELSGAERALVGDLVRQARAEGVALTGPDGLLKALTKTVLEAALQEEMTEHLGYDRHAAAGRGSGNSRNGSRNKKVITDACGQVEIAVLRDRNGTFEPVIVGKRKRRVTDVDRVVLSLYAKGLTTGEIAAHFADVYGVSVSKDTISRITDRVIEEMQAWWSRPLEKVYAAVFIDAIMVKIRDGQVRNRPVYAAIASTSTATRTSWGCGPAKATVSQPNFGWQCSPTCAIVGSKTSSSWSATASKGCPTACPRRSRWPRCRPASSI